MRHNILLQTFTALSKCQGLLERLLLNTVQGMFSSLFNWILLLLQLCFSASGNNMRAKKIKQGSITVEDIGKIVLGHTAWMNLVYVSAGLFLFCEVLFYRNVNLNTIAL